MTIAFDLPTDHDRYVVIVHYRAANELTAYGPMDQESAVEWVKQGRERVAQLYADAPELDVRYELVNLDR